jgi:hypothetical protein
VSAFRSRPRSCGDVVLRGSFLHHEELYHSTPETQTDESYTHPEGTHLLFSG